MINYPAEEGAMLALVSTFIGRGGYNLKPGHPILGGVSRI